MFKIQDGRWIYANKKYVPLPRVTPSFVLKAKTYILSENQKLFSVKKMLTEV